MNVLVCGADGFIGGHVVRALRTHGHDVVGTVYRRAPRAHERKVDLVRDHLHGALPRHVDAIVNAVGEVSGSASRAQVFAANLEVTQRLGAWAAATGVRHFVQLSSVAVYGPLVLGEDRDEHTPRVGAVLGLPYMRSKARAEAWLERSGVPFSLLRAPAVVGTGDTVVSTGLVRALNGDGLPMPPLGSATRRVSLASGDGLAEIVRQVLRQGPLGGALHCGHLDTTLADVAAAYARKLGRIVRFRPLRAAELAALVRDAGLGWLIASARYGQHYSTAKLGRFLPLTSLPTLEDAVSEGVSGLQGQVDSLF